MSFIHEILSEDRIIKYNQLGLDVPYEWYVDNEKDASVWVTSTSRGWQDFAEGNVKTIVKLRIKNQVIDFYMETSPSGSSNFSDTPFLIIWDEATEVFPKDLFGINYESVITLLKEALSSYGGGYRNNSKWHPNFIVQFNF